MFQNQIVLPDTTLVGDGHARLSDQTVRDVYTGNPLVGAIIPVRVQSSLTQMDDLCRHRLYSYIVHIDQFSFPGALLCMTYQSTCPSHA